MSTDEPNPGPAGDLPDLDAVADLGGAGGGLEAAAAGAARDIADVTAVEVITTAAVHMMSAAAVRCGLEEGPQAEDHKDLAEARVLIQALAGLVTAAAPDIGNQHARALRDGLRSLQLAFREASVVQDPLGQGPGERLTGPVS